VTNSENINNFDIFLGL